jgi:hypothetical protein
MRASCLAKKCALQRDALQGRRATNAWRLFRHIACALTQSDF